MKTKKTSEIVQKTYSLLSVPLLIVVFFLCICAASYELRQNNIHMIKLRQNLLVADTLGVNVEPALNDLRIYVFGHMNTNVNTNESSEAPIQLVNTYYRAILQVEAQDAVRNGTQALYNSAITSCSAQGSDLYKNVTCVENYLITHGNGLKNQNLPSKGLYQFNFISPKWSSDLAGWLIVLSILSGSLLVFRIITSIFTKN